MGPACRNDGRRQQAGLASTSSCRGSSSEKAWTWSASRTSSMLEGDLESAWSDGASAAQAVWGPMPVVGYDKGESLDAAHRAGFETIGSLAAGSTERTRNSAWRNSRLRQCFKVTPEPSNDLPRHPRAERVYVPLETERPSSPRVR